MKFITLFIVPIITTTSLTACGQETYTVDFLKENETKRMEVLEACKANKQSDENCKNTNEAEKAIKTAEYGKKMFGH